jgi:hypothetical protein
MKHRFKSIEGAVRRIREMDKIIARDEEICQRYANDRRLLARLCADGPCFNNPLEVFAAKRRRDEILREDGLKPDGTSIYSLVKPEGATP